MTISFGNLSKPKHNDNYSDSEDMVREMMDKLTAAGFTRVEDVDASRSGDRNYHIYDMPHSITLSSHSEEAVDIMKLYSKYMQPIQVIA